MALVNKSPTSQTSEAGKYCFEATIGYWPMRYEAFFPSANRTKATGQEQKLQSAAYVSNAAYLWPIVSCTDPSLSTYSMFI